MTREDLLKWLWVIFIIEGDCRASVPFGWVKRKAEWKARATTFRAIFREVLNEIKLEYRKWQKAKERGYQHDFVHWLAVVGYNANPAEAPTWEKNFRGVAAWLDSLLKSVDN
jgi:hypothetical protein